MNKSSVNPDEPCPNHENHTKCPDCCLEWQEWAKLMDKTHKQVKCQRCGLWAIWVRRDN